MKQFKNLGRHFIVVCALAVSAAGVVALPLVLYPSDRHAMLDAVAVFAAGADRFIVGAPVTIASEPHVTIDSGTISLARSVNASPKDQKSIAKMLVAGSSAIAIEDAVLRVNLYHDPNDTVALEQSRARYNVADDSAFLIPIVKAIVRHNFSALALRRCTVLVEIPGKSPYRLENTHLDVRIDNDSTLTLVGSVQYRGQTVDVFSRFGLEGLKEQPDRYPIRANFRNDRIYGEFDGIITYGARARIVASRANLKFESLGDTSRWLGLAWAKTGPKDKLEAEGTMEWSPDGIAFPSATFTLGKNKATGALSLDYRNSRPILEGTLAARNLDLTPYISNKQRQTALSLIQSSLWLDRLGVGTHSELTRFIRALDADLRVSSDAVKIANFESTHAAATITVRDGKLLADFAETQLVDGGSGEIQISFDANGFTPKTGIRGRVSGSGLSKALEWAFGHSFVSGDGTLSIAVTGEGVSRYEFMNTMNGTMSAEIPGMSNLAVDLQALLQQRYKGVVLPQWGHASSSVTPLEDVTASLVIKNGLAKIRELRGAFGKSLLVVSGEIEFPAKAVDLQLSVAERHTGERPSATPDTGRAILHATGNWSKPNVMSLDRAGRALKPTNNGTGAATRQ